MVQLIYKFLQKRVIMTAPTIALGSAASIATAAPPLIETFTTPRTLNLTEKIVLVVLSLLTVIGTVIYLRRRGTTCPPLKPKPTVEAVDKTTAQHIGPNACIIKNIDSIFAELFVLFKTKSKDPIIDRAAVAMIDLKNNTVKLKRADSTPLKYNSEERKKLTNAAKLIKKYVTDTGLLKTYIDQGNNQLLIDFSLIQTRPEGLGLHQDRLMINEIKDIVNRNRTHPSNARWGKVEGDRKPPNIKHWCDDLLGFVYDKGDGPLLPTPAIESSKNPEGAYMDLVKKDLYRIYNNPNTLFNALESHKLIFPDNLQAHNDLYLFKNHYTTLHAAPNRAVVQQLMSQKAADASFISGSNSDFSPGVVNRGFIRFAISAVYSEDK
ncbi:MAG: hypothetical protein SP4CHLAM5_06430 [Chlamydiia bacterium]|nr:hypothetical protein [Chlamydiia bacterium]MCH9618511.1 hypothetical protein [Chlamydiia bacterium]MCH9623800.1 hypothetical protein [Chlamydiia bacterium]